MQSTANPTYRNPDRAPRRYRWTIADYHKLRDGILDQNVRVELVNGELFEMAPIGSLHAGKLERLRRLLERAGGAGVLVFSQNPVVLGNDSEPQPDIAVLHPREDFYEGAHPGPAEILLLVELADSSIDYDRNVKIPLYARYGIPEAWLVDLREMYLAVYRSPENGVYRHVDYYRKGRVPLWWCSEAAIDLKELF